MHGPITTSMCTSGSAREDLAGLHQHVHAAGANTHSKVVALVHKHRAVLARRAPVVLKVNTPVCPSVSTGVALQARGLARPV